MGTLTYLPLLTIARRHSRLLEKKKGGEGLIGKEEKAGGLFTGLSLLCLCVCSEQRYLNISSHSAIRLYFNKHVDMGENPSVCL